MKRVVSMTGKFVTFEGPEGSGKTSVIQRVFDHFAALGVPVLKTREPGGSRIAEKIRDILLDNGNTEMDPRTEALLFAASRRQHLAEKVLPALAEGKLVLCDRFLDSSLAYQGVARGLGIDEVFSINRFAIGNLLPDLTIFVNVRPEVGLARIAANHRTKVDRLDNETVEFHHRLYEGYLELMKRYPDRIRPVDGEAPIDEVAKAAVALIEKIL